MTSTKKAGYTMSDLSNLPHREVMGDECAIEGCLYESDGGSRYCAEHKPIAKKAGYTPGLWKVKAVFIRQSMTESLHFGEYTIDLFGIAGRTTPPNTSPTLSREEAEANAKLIAQCPPMVEVLLAIIESATDGREIPEWLAERLKPVPSILLDAGVIDA